MIFTSSLQITVVTLSGAHKTAMLAVWSTGPGNVAFEVKNPTDMADKVVAKSREVGAPIQRLNFLSHGSHKSINIGFWVIDDDTIKGCETEMRRLRGVLSGESLIHLMGCNIGKNEELLKAMARMTGVPVYGQTGEYNSALRFTVGDYVRAMPGGTVERGVARP